MKTTGILSALCILWLAVLSCNFPGLGSAPDDSQPAQEQPGGAAESQVDPAGEPVLTLQSGTGYLFGAGEVVTGSDQRDVWWNGATLVPGQLIGSLGPVDDLSAVTEIHASVIAERQLEPVPGEAYVMPTVDGQYVLLRILSRGGQAEITVEWLYPFAGQVLP
jgi:hypothetical protein